MSRKERARKLASEEPAEQVKDLCFNIYGHAFEHPEDHRAEVVLITANEASSTPFRKALEIMKKQSPPESRESFKLTERETSPPDLRLSSYLLVGWVPAELNAEHRRMSKEVAKQKPVGVRRPRTVLQFDDDNLPSMAVTPVTDHKPYSVKLYALLYLKGGVCTPYSIGQKDVFYLPQYRDNTTSKDRGPAWNRLVLKASVRLQTVASEKQAKYKRARDNIRLVLEPEQSFANEVLCLARGYEASKNPWFLSELIQILDEADEDLKYAPPLASALGKFTRIDAVDEFDEFDAEGVLQELSDLRPEQEIVGLTVGGILETHKALHKSHIVLEYRHMESFLVESLFRLSREGSLNVEEVLATVERMLGKINPREVNDSDTTMLSTIRQKLVEMVEAAKVFDGKLKEVAGDQGMETSLADIWSSYSDIADTDATRAAFMGVVKLFAAALRQKEQGLANMASDLLEVLDKLNEE
jgi:cytochrome c556